MLDKVIVPIDPAKFRDPLITAKGDERAFVTWQSLETLWFNTGTLCNIECANCYIESSPTNDALVYLTLDEVCVYLDEIDQLGWQVREIALTGGEPFMNPDACAIINEALGRGYEVLVLTNAMQPMLRPKIKDELLKTKDQYSDKLKLRVSLDHHSQIIHEAERGKGSWDKAMEGLSWLSDNDFKIDVAGRRVEGEDEVIARQSYSELFACEGVDCDAQSPAHLILFPEMDENVDVPEITIECWGILGKSPNEMMCSNSRMVVKHKGSSTPSVIACTLLPYVKDYDLGTTLEEATKTVPLNHPHCAKFCVLGGASCSVSED